MALGFTTHSLRIIDLESYVRFRGSWVALCKLPVPMPAT